MEFSRGKLNDKFLVLSWALYDLANQFFAINIVSFCFPLWLDEKKSPEILYSIFFAISMLLVGILAPVLGVISDIRQRRKVFLIYFTLLSVIFTALLGVAGNIFLGLLFFAIANLGCQGAIVFYNALMIKVAPPNKLGFVSGLGRMFGYLGAIIALLLSKPVVLKFGYQATFLLTSVLFLIFSLPCMIFIKEEPSKEKRSLSFFFKKQELLQILRRLKDTLLDSYKFRELRTFLKAAFFGLCVVNTIILFMSVYASKAFGLTNIEIMNLIIFSAIFALLGSIFSGFISDIIGYKRSLIGVFFLWGLCLLVGALLRPPWHWLIGGLAGLSLGSTWVVCRALVIKLVPRQRVGEAFGLFNLVGYAAGMVGPIWWGLLLLFFSSWGEWGYRITLFSLILFIAIGLIFLLRMHREVTT